MTRIFRVRPSASMIVAMVALFVALAGGATAATVKLITGAQIKNNSITGVDVKNGSLSPADFTGSVQGPQGPQGAQGPTGPTGPTGRSAFDGPIPSGKTVKGVWGNEDWTTVATQFSTHWESFAVPASAPLDLDHTKFGVNGTNGTLSPLVKGLVPDAWESGSCTGTFHNPTAPPGMLCMYLRDTFGPLNVLANSLTVWPPENTTHEVNQLGFTWQYRANVAATTNRIEGSWAYTAS